MRPSTSLSGVVLASIFLIGAGASMDGRLSGVNQSSKTATVPKRRAHTIGEVWMSVGSNGLLGSQADAYAAEPDSEWKANSGFEFPGGSRREHLFGSGLWIGGLDGGGRPRVVASMLSGSQSVPAFTPIVPFRTRYDSDLGSQIFEVTYVDTIANQDHNPALQAMGLEVRQTSQAYESPPYNRFVNIEYLIRNISRDRIRKVHVGFFADPDVFNELRSGQTEVGTADDLVGYLRDLGIAYTFDNDGDSAGATASAISRNWCPSGFGLAPVMMDPLPTCTSFNWWATNFEDVNWGPYKLPSRSPSIPSGPTLPWGESALYWTMANGEIDYDQVFAGLDYRPSGWASPPPSSIVQNLVDGSDSRWTLAYCFDDLAPNDSLRIVMAYLIGDSIHQLPGTKPEAKKPDSFYAKLNFDDLRRNVALARSAWSRRSQLEGAAAFGVTLQANSDSSVMIRWSAAPYSDIGEYSVLTRRVDSPSSWLELARLPASELSFLASSLEPGWTYEFSIASISRMGRADAKTRPKQITLGFPPTPSLRAHNDHGSIILTWSAPTRPPEFTVNTYLTVYRGARGTTLNPYLQLPLVAAIDKNARASNEAIVDPSSAPPWRDLVRGPSHVVVDDSVSPGVWYEYQVQLTNALGLRSEMSKRISTVPMPFNKRGLILMGGASHASSLVDEALQFEFYGTWAHAAGFDTARSALPRSPYRDSLISLKHLSQYECVIVVSEDVNELGLAYSPGLAMLDYCRNGGKSIYVTRNHGYAEFFINNRYLVSGIISRLTGVEWVIKEAMFPRGNVLMTEFLGANSNNPDYLHIEADSSKGWDFQWLRDMSNRVDTVYAAGHVPAIGAFQYLPSDGEVLYTYRSAYESSELNGKPIAIKRITDSTSAIWFNFPLSLMNHRQAWQALTQAVADLGIDTTGYTPPTSSVQANKLIDWLYGRTTDAPDPAWDSNHDGVIDIRDVVEELDR